LVAATLGGILLWRDLRREAELADMRAQFVASVSHELRTPLTSIRMFTETLKLDPDLDEETRQEYLDTMLRETERLSRLLENVLDFSRIERGTKTYARRRIPLAPVVARAARTFEQLMARKGFTLRTDVDAAAPLVDADPDAIEQALINLLGNAMKYSGGSREIELALKRSGAAVEISVTDHGLGIEPAEQSRIFERFYRAPVEENRNIQGAGLGLPLVAHIAAAHQGEVRVESSPGRGSTFTLRLPAAKEAES
jgi:signal transduction histidine kinase